MKNLIIQALESGNKIVVSFDKNHKYVADTLIDPVQSSPNCIVVGLKDYKSTHIINLELVRKVKILNN